MQRKIAKWLARLSPPRPRAVVHAVTAFVHRYPIIGLVPVGLLFLIMLSALVLLGGATQNSDKFEQLYAGLLAVNLIGLIIMIILISVKLTRFVMEFRAGVIGSRLALRLVIMFLFVAAIPVATVYYFSLQFLQHGIDSWFDVSIEQALQDSLDLSRESLDLRVRQLVGQTEGMVHVLNQGSEGAMAAQLSRLHADSDSIELTLFNYSGRVIAYSLREGSGMLPTQPDETILLQVRQGYNYVSLDPVRGGELFVRIVVLLPDTSPLHDPYVLQALYPVPERVNVLVDSVNDAFAYYRELLYLREPLKDSFVVTLSLVLLLTLLTAVWVAFFATRRLVEPIRVLAAGTRSVAAGDYNQKLPLPSNDEFGSLVDSFNDMTQKIALARDDVKRTQEQADRERAYLRAVLGGLTSGVLTLDHRFMIRTVNSAARQVLEVDFESLMGRHFSTVSKRYEHMQEFVQTVVAQFEQPGREWQEQIVVFGGKGRKVLMCHGATLAEKPGYASGFVLVFDDVTALIQAQRDAAWSEVARRLAHEIKNPLTPIQLAAERLRRKYLKSMAAEDAELLDRSTHTIVQQVQAMEEMVKAFSDYAHTPKLQLTLFDLNRLIDEVAELYRGNRQITLHHQDEVMMVQADKGRMRQLLHNLIKNAQEAVSELQDGVISINVSQGEQYVDLAVEDNGPGIPEEVFDQLFEPYVTTKPKGTGLGLAIVKKIVEEHGGFVRAENLTPNGTRITARMPMQHGVQSAGVE